MEVEKIRREKTVRRILGKCQRILASEGGRLPIPPDGGTWVFPHYT